MGKKIKPSDLEREAQRLIDEGNMPSLETLLQVIAEIRKKYLPLIARARGNLERRRETEFQDGLARGLKKNVKGD